QVNLWPVLQPHLPHGPAATGPSVDPPGATAMPPPPPWPATNRDARHSPTVSVVIPALNEEDNLPVVLEGLPPVDEIVIVDGGSADDTVAVAREVRPDAVVVRQTRTGKGNALACGFAASRSDIVITLNADGSTDPGEIPRYVDALLCGAEVAHGSRYRDGGGDLGGNRLDRLGNALLSRLVNALFGTRFTDLGYGYNAYWRSVLAALELPPIDAPRVRRGQPLWGDGPEIEPLINIRTAAQGMRVVEVASVGYPPINGVRERHRLRRAVRALRTALAEYLRRWRIGRRPAETDGIKRGREADATAGAWRGSIGATSGARHGTVGAPVGPWRDLTSAPRYEAQPGVRYDPTTDEQHDLDPAARRHLPLYPPPDPSWTRSSGRHAAVGDPSTPDPHLDHLGAERTGAGVNHRVEPSPGDAARPDGPQREVGGGRRRLETWERRVERRPDLSPGEGWKGRGGERPGHLRAVPGDRNGR
ncbi:MAG TPA: glycosyltransferase family 2 protein, partial [Actinoplanes sp.]|nr:glycosyltransferase family 2 protein [Actinoplanes sp.]